MDRNLKIRMVLEAGDRVSRPLREIATGSSRAAQALKTTRDQLKGIEEAQADIHGFKALKAGLSETTTKLGAAKTHVEALKREIASADAPTAKMSRALGKAERELTKLEVAERNQSRELKELELRLHVAGVAADDLTGHERRLRTEALQANRAIRQQSEEVRQLADRKRRLDAARGAFTRSQDGAAKMSIAGASAIGAGMVVTAPIRAMAKEAIDFESSMADVRKVVDGLEDASAFKAMSGDIIDLSTRLPMAANGIAAIVAAGGQAGIQRGELLGFAEDATKMAIAFDVTAEVAGDTMAKWRSAFGIGREGVMKLGDQVNKLGNSTAASAPLITDIVTRIGPLGAVGGLASGEIAALGATLGGMGIESEVAATGIKNTMLALTKGEAATKSQRAAFNALGLDAEKVSRSMQRDAAGTIVDVMKRIGQLPKAAQAGLLTQLFGSESVAAIAPMLTQLDTLKKNLRLVGDSTAYAGSMEAEYQSRSKTTANTLQLAENNLTALKITMGNELLPTINSMAQGLGRGIKSFRAFAQEHPAIAGGIMKTVAALGALMVAAGSFLFVGAGMRAALGPFQFVARLMGTTLSGSLLRFGSALLGPLRFLPMLGRGIMTLALTVGRAGMMLLANPIVLAIVAIAAAIGLVAFLVWKHWDKIKAGFLAGAAWVAGLVPRFKALGGMIIDGLLSMLNPTLFVQRLVTIGKAGITAFKSVLGIKSPSRVFRGLGGHVMDGLSDGLARGEVKPLGRVDSLARRLTEAMAVGTLAPAVALGAPGVAYAGAQSGGAGGSGFAAAAPRYEIHLHAAPGMDEAKFMAMLERKLDDIKRRDAAAARSAMADRPDWQE